MLLYNQQPHLPTSNKRNYGHLLQKSPKPSQKPDEPFRRLVARQPRHAREESTQGISVIGQQCLLATAEPPWLGQTLPVQVKSRASTSHAGLHKEGPGTHSQPMQVTCVIIPMVFHFGPRTAETPRQLRQEFHINSFFCLVPTTQHLVCSRLGNFHHSSGDHNCCSSSNLSDLAVMPPLSQLIWDAHCSVDPHAPIASHTWSHQPTPVPAEAIFSQCQVRLPFFDLSFQKQGYLKLGRISEGSEKKSSALSTYTSTGHRKGQWQEPRIFQIGGYVLAPMLLCSTCQFYKNGTTSLTHACEGSFLSLVLFISHTFGVRFQI